MTPERIGELVAATVSSMEEQLGQAAAQADLLTWRREAARELLGSLRRTGSLLEEIPELPELPPHPDVPEPGEWIRDAHRHRSNRRPRSMRDAPHGAWHLFTWAQEPEWEPRRGYLLEGWTNWRLWTACNRAIAIWDHEATENRTYVQRSVTAPEGACRRCLAAEPKLRQVGRLLRSGGISGQ